MIPILCQWLLASFTAIGIGTILSKFLSEDNNKSDFDLLVFLVGFAAVSWLGCIWSLFVPLNKYFLLSLFLLATIGSAGKISQILTKETFSNIYSRSNLFHALLVLVITCISLVFVSGVTENSDHFEYYLPTVKWMEDIPVVPGTALFNHRLGNNSNFHLLSATFSLHDIKRGGTYALNGLFFILFYSYFLSKIPSLTNKAELRNILAVSATIFPFTFLLDSMDVDYLTIMGGIFILIQCLDFNKEQNDSNNKMLSIFLVILFLTTVRVLSVLYLFPLILLGWKQLDRKTYFLMIIIGLIFLTPWFIRNYYISGYLIFPLYYFDFFNPEWKTPIDVAKASYEIISEFAKVNIIRDGYLYEGMREWQLRAWFPIWLQNQRSILIGVITILGIPIAFIISIFNNIKTRESRPNILGLNLIIYCVIAFWFFNFPSIRFIWPWILIFIIINGYVFALHVSNMLHRVFCYTIFILGLLGFGSVIKKTFTSLPLKANSVITFEHQQEVLENIIFLRSANAECGDLNPPCLPQENKLEIIPLGDKVEDGFRVRE